MKKLALVALSMVLLAGCSANQDVTWQTGSQMTLSQVTVELKSNLWLNLMPTVEEGENKTLHGALYLHGNKELPATLTVDAIMLKQNDQQWLIDTALLDLRTHSENQWEVAFTWPLELDTERPVDIAVLLEDGRQQVWLVEKAVTIDKLY
ncbi:hypothetical protein [Vibrio sp. CAU 1672]|uniref:hypothetical protein n=1 Tax=Vibrio sp. CAU 1672 TaxID=3032594 RepID=UPI0023DB46CA|nr:hypothetical protein [Vibrio sp. CAU 1672]MDF2153343.1 hypothetical protein [Vibrio sp. CAU 1672]